jgi:outer membrane protein assembly factor BamB
VFFPYSDGHVAAYDVRDGSERWTPIDLSAEAEQAKGEAVRYLDVDTTPVPYSIPTIGRVVFVGSYAGGVFALDAERGVTVWKNEKATGVSDLLAWSEPAHAPNPALPGYVPGEPPVPKHAVLFASSASTGLWALDPANGRKLWTLPLPEGGITAPVPVAGALLVGTTRYGAFLLSPVQGRPIDGFDLGTGFSQAPAAFGNRAYLLSNGGTLVAVHVNPPPRTEL